MSRALKKNVLGMLKEGLSHNTEQYRRLLKPLSMDLFSLCQKLEVITKTNDFGLRIHHFDRDLKQHLRVI